VLGHQGGTAVGCGHSELSTNPDIIIMTERCFFFIE